MLAIAMHEIELSITPIGTTKVIPLILLLVVSGAIVDDATSDSESTGILEEVLALASSDS